MLRFSWLDNIAHQNTIIDEVVVLTPAELTASQLELEFSHSSTSSEVVTASHAFGSGNTFASFNGALSTFGSTDGSTDIFTPAKQFASSLGFEAIDPVPEPSSLTILALALGSLGVFRRYAK